MGVRLLTPAVTLIRIVEGRWLMERKTPAQIIPVTVRDEITFIRDAAH